MPRGPRLDAPGLLHHVMVRGIERRPIFWDDGDPTNFVARLAALAEAGSLMVHAWALLPNHAHLLAGTGSRPLARCMRSLLTPLCGGLQPPTQAGWPPLPESVQVGRRGGCSRTSWNSSATSTSIPCGQGPSRPSGPSIGIPGPVTARSSDASRAPGRRRARSSPSLAPPPAVPGARTGPSWPPGSPRGAGPSSKAGASSGAAAVGRL
jgi:hypothetical protein